MVLTKHDRLPASICDADVKLSVEGAFRLVEDMVTELMGAQHIDGVTCMREYGAMWVFVRNRIELPEPLLWLEEYTARSYISSFTRARLYVDTVVEKADGTAVLRSRLEQCAVDLDTGRIRKSETVGVGDSTPAETPLFDMVYSKEKPERDELADEVLVRSSDIDFCKHTNNISYVRYFINQYPVEQLIRHPVRAIELQYVNQTHEGDLLKLYHCKASASEAFMIEHGGSKVTTCIIERDL